MDTKWKIQSASHIGRQHILNFTNCQDSVTLINDSEVIIGIVCDGCSEGHYSETGARLSSYFLAYQAWKLYSQEIEIKGIPTILYKDLTDYLRMQIPNNLDQLKSVEFVKNHLLSTVVGFILTDELAVVFIGGDGTIVINNEVNFVDSNNRPMYPAYHLVDRKFLSTGASDLPNSFEVFFYDTSYIEKLAIGSDAWKDEGNLISQIWGFKHPSGLQRKVNQWSRLEKRFRDDVSIITAERDHSGKETTWKSLSIVKGFKSTTLTSSEAEVKEAFTKQK